MKPIEFKEQNIVFAKDQPECQPLPAFRHNGGMDEATKKKLIDAGRKDLVDACELTESGYAGVNSKGTIVDRRKFPDAIPVQANPMFSAPEPKSLNTPTDER